MAKRYARRGHNLTVPARRPLVPFLVVATVVVALAFPLLPQGSAEAPDETSQDVAMVAPFTCSDSGTPTATASTRLTSDLTALRTPLPTATARQIRRLPTSVPTPTATPRIFPEQYIANGGFEKGLDNWYVKPGAEVTGTLVRRGVGAMRIDATGAFASNRFLVSPGTAYRLSVWRIMSAAGGAGIIGVE